MKKILFVLSVLTLVSYGCNRNEDAGAPAAGRVQEEQSRPMDTQNMDSDTVIEKETTIQERQVDRPGQSPGFEKEEVREEYNEDTNITTPVDDRPELEEEMEN